MIKIRVKYSVSHCYLLFLEVIPFWHYLSTFLRKNLLPLSITWYIYYIAMSTQLDTGQKLNIHKTFRRLLGRYTLFQARYIIVNKFSKTNQIEVAVASITFLPFLPLSNFHRTSSAVVFFLKLGFTPCKAEQPLRNKELQEKEIQKD